MFPWIVFDKKNKYLIRPEMLDLRVLLGGIVTDYWCPVFMCLLYLNDNIRDQRAETILFNLITV